MTLRLKLALGASTLVCLGLLCVPAGSSQLQKVEAVTLSDASRYRSDFQASSVGCLEVSKGLFHCVVYGSDGQAVASAEATTAGAVFAPIDYTFTR